jgi:hypothetical protein
MQESVRVLKQLALPPAKPESKELTQLRMRARALLSGVLGMNEALDLAVLLAQAQQREWRTLALAEYVLNNADASPAQVSEAAASLERMREADKTFLRTYVLGARIALMREDFATAQALMETVITLNPKHELAQLLHAHAQELARQASEPEPSPEEQVPVEAPVPTSPTEAAPGAPPEGAPGAPSGAAPGAATESASGDQATATPTR